VLDGVSGKRHTPAALPPGKSPGTHFIGGWMYPRACLDGCGKSRPHQNSIPGPSSPVASRYTDYDIPAHNNNDNNNNYYNACTACGYSQILFLLVFSNSLSFHSIFQI